MPGEGAITVADGRTVGFYDYGPEGATPVLWAHGGPGSRMEPAAVAPAAAEAGFRIVGIDRPGYGLSTPRPGRSIADWVLDGLAVADHLGIDRFAAVGVSTEVLTRWRWPRAILHASSASSRAARSPTCNGTKGVSSFPGRRPMASGTLPIARRRSRYATETFARRHRHGRGGHGSTTAASSGSRALR